MSLTLGVEPLDIIIDDHSVRFEFREPVRNVLEIPPAFEAELRALVREHGAEFTAKMLVVDLENMPALSSRQLGMLLTVREVMRPFGKVQLQHVSPSVKQLLQLTGTERFFGKKGS